MNGVSLWDVNLEMYVVFSEAEFAELKAKAFKVPERLDTGVDVAFFRKFRYLLCVGNIMVTQLLRVSSVIFLELPLLTTFIILYFSCRIRKGAGECLPHATKRRYGFSGEKRDATFHLRVFHFVSDHAVFSVVVNKNLCSYFWNFYCFKHIHFLFSDR